MNLSYKLTPLADIDLSEIWAYTNSHWGNNQANLYLEELEICLNELCQLPTLGKERPEIREGYFSINKNKHVIFYRMQNHCIEVARVLHQRMDIAQHL